MGGSDLLLFLPSGCMYFFMHATYILKSFYIMALCVHSFSNYLWNFILTVFTSKCSTKYNPSYRSHSWAHEQVFNKVQSKLPIPQLGTRASVQQSTIQVTDPTVGQIRLGESLRWNISSLSRLLIRWSNLWSIGDNTCAWVPYIL